MHPDLGKREWHPFTCVVNAATKEGYILVKNYGDWTSKFNTEHAPITFIFIECPPRIIAHMIPSIYDRVLVVASGTFITTVVGTCCPSVCFDHGATQDVTILWADRE